MAKLIVSLTSIPPRFEFLPQVIQSLAAQTVKPDSIEVYLPRFYRRHELNTFKIGEKIDLHDICKIIWIDHDYGPASKILPASIRYRGTETKLVYCDDDKIYHPFMLEAMLRTAEANPDCVIANRVQSSTRLVAKARWTKKGVGYRVLRALTLGTWKPVRSKSLYYIDIALGCDGVMISPDFIDDEAYQIPEIMWTVDDIWLSGIYLKNGKTIVKVKYDYDIKNEEICSYNKTVGSMHALIDYVFRGHDRAKANSLCIKYMRNRFKVFL